MIPFATPMMVPSAAAASGGVTNMIYVGGTTGTEDVFGNASSLVSLTGLTGGVGTQPATGDLVLVAWSRAHQNDTNPGSLSVSGYTSRQQLFQAVSSGSHRARFAMIYKFMGGTPDTQIQFPGTGSSLLKGAVAIQVWRGVDATTPFDIANVTASGFGEQPNCPAATPATRGAVMIAAGCAGTNTNFTNGDLSNMRRQAASDTYTTSVGMGSKIDPVSAFDPEIWDDSAQTVQNAWAAMTTALRPAVPS